MKIYVLIVVLSMIINMLMKYLLKIIIWLCQIYYFIKKTIYKRKKYLYNKCFYIKEINENIILFFDNSLEDIRKLYNMKRISISTYLNSIYKFYCDISSINYQPIFKNKKIINLSEDVIKISEKSYLEYPHYVKKENDYYYL